MPVFIPKSTENTQQGGKPSKKGSKKTQKKGTKK